MQITGQVALVTGANRGIGRYFTEELLRRGAAKVYAGARSVSAELADGAERLTLDITDGASVQAAAAEAGDVTLLINNAGISLYQELVAGDLTQMHAELDTNLWGTLDMTRAFAPILAANGGGGILNIVSSAAWLVVRGNSSYAVSKAANWSMTNAVREELREQGTQVSGVYVGLVETDITRGIDAPMTPPLDFVNLVLDAFEQGDEEILADEVTRELKAAQSGPPVVVSLL